MMMELDKVGASESKAADGNELGRMDTIRIFVGGLGRNVTDDDLRRMFAALGGVDEIEIIRTKGRSMAYLNFTPSTPKSLAKLFSSYNGCAWKGGKLRIEKAKEHYLIKMERERELEQEELANNEAVEKCSVADAVVSSKRLSKGPVDEKEQIRIFFPKLRKVKPLPFSGCGKHKYSFRNIPVPRLPIHFCDCEEHYVPYEAPKRNGLVSSEVQNTGVDEEEFNLMSSVLNKFIARDEKPSEIVKFAEPCEDKDISPLSNDTPQADEIEIDREPDEDGIIINISGTKSRAAFSGNLEKKIIAESQDPIGFLSQISNDAKCSNKDNNKDSKLQASIKKRKMDVEEDTASVIAALKRKKDKNNGSATSMEGDKISGESIPLWTQKSKWKELVGQGSDSMFKLSNVLPSGSTVDKQRSPDIAEDSTDVSSQDEQPDVSNQESSDSDEDDESAEADASIEDSSDESVQDLKHLENEEDEPIKSEGHDDVVGKEELIVDGESSESEESDGLKEAEASINESVEGIAEQGEPESEEDSQQEGVKPSDTNDKSVNLKTGATWSQKMPWTQLMSDRGSFSISQILPSGTIQDQASSQPIPDTKDIQNSHFSSGISPETTLTSSVNPTKTTAVPAEQMNFNGSKDHSRAQAHNPSLTTRSEDKEFTTPEAAPAPEQTHVKFTGTYEFRPFVRSAASLKEWTKTKEALRKSRNKKKPVPVE